MEGDVLAARIRERYPTLPVLYLTAFADHLFENGAGLRENEAFLEKPATPDAVLEAVSMLLAARAVPQPYKPGIMSFGSLRQRLLTLNVSGHHR
jgi:FixJ family two-component response regulator